MDLKREETKSLREKEKEKGISLIFIQVVQGTRTNCYKKNIEPKKGSSRTDLT